MEKYYSLQKLSLISCLLFVLSAASCSKGGGGSPKPGTATPKKNDKNEHDTAEKREKQTPKTKLGTQSVILDMIFDTGSGGMVCDAQGVLPASMITTDGFVITGDSTVVDGITVTNQKTAVMYGADDATLSTVYGNLAYADVTVGDSHGNVTVKHLPFLLYYKAVNTHGVTQPAHDFDVLGVSSEYDIYYPNKSYITSPFVFFFLCFGF